MAKEQFNNQMEKGTEKVFEGGPTKDAVENWKNQFGGDIYMTEFDTETFIWRPISRLEFKKIVNAEGNQDDFYREERVTELCVLWPENYSHDDIIDGKAGVPAVLADQIMNKSGFLPTTGAKKL
jgi:hypothetical protein